MLTDNNFVSFRDMNTEKLSKKKHTLAAAASAGDIMELPDHWEIRPLLASITSNEVFNAHNIFHIKRGLNFRAHYQAKLGRRLQNRLCTLKCPGLSQDSGHLPNVSSLFG
jgi:hypothetical protein